MKGKKILMILVCAILTIASIFMGVRQSIEKKASQTESAANEIETETKSLLEKVELETEAETEVGKPSADEDLSPEKTTVSISLENADELNALISLQGQTHLISDLETYLKKNDLEDAEKIYVVQDTALYEGGVVSFDCRIDVTGEILTITYTEKDDIFSFYKNE